MASLFGCAGVVAFAVWLYFLRVEVLALIAPARCLGRSCFLLVTHRPAPAAAYCVVSSSHARFVAKIGFSESGCIAAVPVHEVLDWIFLDLVEG